LYRKSNPSNCSFSLSEFQDIDIPPVGSHVQVTGSYVKDKEHGEWTEIHPITTMAKS